MSILMGFCLAVLWGLGCGNQALDEKALIIDVRTPQEFQAGHIKNAINIPHDEIAEKIGEVTEGKDREIILYCRSGRRSGIALETLKGLGYTEVKNAGGYEALKKQLGQ